MRKIIFTLIAFATLQGCKKENDRPQWQVDVVGPIAYASLGIENLIADSLLQINSSHAVSFVYEDTFYNTSPDSIFRIRDTVIPTIVIIPLTYTFQPNSPFYASSNNATLGISGVELRLATVKSGYLRIETQNHMQKRVVYSLSIPKAKLNGIPFHVTTTMDAAPSGGVSDFIGLYDMTGYKLDLTGLAGDKVNTLVYDIAAQTDTGGTPVTVNLNDTLVNISVGIQSIVPYYAKGYLGQREFNEGPFIRYTHLFSPIQSGSFKLDEVTMKMTIENNIGVDAQATINVMQSVNTLTSNNVFLSAPQLINHPLNINRASESGNPLTPVIPTEYVTVLNNSNSNLRAFLQNQPDRFNYALQLKINPLGNISSGNDFIYTDYLVNAKIKIEVPLAFAADHLSFADTSAFTVQNQQNYDAVGPGTITLIADNGFPFEAAVRLYLLDAGNHFVDSIPVNTTIAAAPVDANFKVIASRRTLVPLYIDEARKKRILQGGNLSVHASFTTPDFPQTIQIYSDYRLDLKLVGDASYLIR